MLSDHMVNLSTVWVTHPCHSFSFGSWKKSPSASRTFPPRSQTLRTASGWLLANCFYCLLNCLPYRIFRIISKIPQSWIKIVLRSPAWKFLHHRPLAGEPCHWVLLAWWFTTLQAAVLVQPGISTDKLQSSQWQCKTVGFFSREVT